MRILVVAPGPSYSVADVQRGWEKALRNLGHEVRTYNLDDRMSFFASAQWADRDDEYHGLTGDDATRLSVEPLGNACYKFWPDIIFVVSGFFVPDDLWALWKQRRWHKTVLLCTESPYEDDVQFGKVAEYEPDVVLLNDPVNADAFRTVHDRVGYAPHAYDPQMHHPGGARAGYESDFAFVGTGYASRRDLFARVDWRGTNVKLAGNWLTLEGTCLEDFVMHPIKECFENEDAADLYRSCKVSANLYRAHNSPNEANHISLQQGWAVGPREIELAACGTFFLREPRAEGDELFPMLPTFTNAREFTELLRYYLSHDAEREAAATAARAAIVDRTFDAHARRLMQLLPD